MVVQEKPGLMWVWLSWLEMLRTSELIDCSLSLAVGAFLLSQQFEFFALFLIILTFIRIYGTIYKQNNITIVALYILIPLFIFLSLTSNNFTGVTIFYLALLGRSCFSLYLILQTEGLRWIYGQQ